VGRCCRLIARHQLRDRGCVVAGEAVEPRQRTAYLRGRLRARVTERRQIRRGQTAVPQNARGQRSRSWGHRPEGQRRRSHCVIIMVSGHESWRSRDDCSRLEAASSTLELRLLRLEPNAHPVPNRGVCAVGSTEDRVWWGVRVEAKDPARQHWSGIPNWCLKPLVHHGPFSQCALTVWAELSFATVPCLQKRRSSIPTGRGDLSRN